MYMFNVLCVSLVSTVQMRVPKSLGIVIKKTKVKKVNQFHNRAEVPRGFQEVKVPRLRDNGPEWW